MGHLFGRIRRRCPRRCRRGQHGDDVIVGGRPSRMGNRLSRRDCRSLSSAEAYDPFVARIDGQRVLRSLAVAIASLGLATIAIEILQDRLGVPNPSALYLAAVVATAIVSGTWGAVAAATASFLLYNYLFVEPRHTLTVARPGELVNLILLLFVGIVVGQLAALQRLRAEIAVAREREARSLFRIS